MMTFDSIPYHGSRLDASIELGQKIADQWGVHSLMIQMARDITGEWHARDRMEESRAIQSWINRRVRYVPDPHGAEMLSDPVTTIQKGGDCDDQAILAAALLQAIGHDARIGAVTWKGRNAASHAVAVDLTAGCIVDPVSVSPDVWPPFPYEVQTIKFRNKAGQMQTMDGLFSKLYKALAKPFTKVFKPHTLLGKVMDPLGLNDPKRNLNLAGRVADVVGTAAAVVMGGYAIGAMAGAGGGFWATTAAGGKLAGAAALKLGAGALKSVAPALVMSAVAGGKQAQPQAAAQTEAWANYGPGADYSGAIVQGGGYGGGGGGGAYTLPDTMPGAVVPVTDTMPPSGIGMGPILIAAAVVGVVLLSRKRKTRGA